jgi:hypothetical protein
MSRGRPGWIGSQNAPEALTARHGLLAYLQPSVGHFAGTYVDPPSAIVA